ncbi:hypothetical protein GCM10010210_11120 [Pseudonocardia hydrocarbonoxydans]|uniref:Uncharacterized protein n=1 Tax=Pseudonocardia hydrocarbonoxydans TaxID=76726 RepID=A0A4Y3WSM0_9PSEU|nr:hypothetical protein PHY01_41500 [Pseudonocardia hydrocarbonoxydans]
MSERGECQRYGCGRRFSDPGLHKHCSRMCSAVDGAFDNLRGLYKRRPEDIDQFDEQWDALCAVTAALTGFYALVDAHRAERGETP